MIPADFLPLYQAAIGALNPRQLSKNSYAGSVAAAILSENGSIYTGVCIDTPCSMGFCAEHAAAAAMVTAGENRAVKLIAVYEDKSVIPPCGRCREFLCQLHDENGACQVLLKDGVYSLNQLLPHRWQ